MTQAFESFLAENPKAQYRTLAELARVNVTVAHCVTLGMTAEETAIVLASVLAYMTEQVLTSRLEIVHASNRSTTA